MDDDQNQSQVELNQVETVDTSPPITPTDNKHEADLKALFGESDDELSDIDPLQGLSDEEEPIQKVKLPNFKKKTATTKKQAKKLKSTTVDEPERPLSPTSAKREEVKRDIDMALSRISGGKKRRRDQVPDEAEIDETMIRMVAKMKDAAEADHESNRKHIPATAKIQLLPKIAEQLQKFGCINRRTQLAEQFLDNSLLDGIKAWLEPLPDASLPSLDIQKQMFKTLSQLPIRTQHLRESRLGRIVKFYEKCERVEAEIQKLASSLLERWMRPILRKSNNYKDKIRKEQFYDPSRRISNHDSIQEEDGHAETHFVRIPTAKGPTSDVVPVSNISIANADQKKPDAFRKLLKKN